MKDKYFVVKAQYRDYIVFVKSGSFWNTYYADAVIIHNIIGYVIRNNRLGFPSKVLDKVLKRIRALSISYVLVYELEDIVVNKYVSNSYAFYFGYQKDSSIV